MESKILAGAGRIDLRTEEEIFSKRHELAQYNQSEALHKAMEKLVSDNFESIGDCWAFFLDNPDMRDRFYQGEIDKEKLKEEGEKGKEAVKKGWAYLLDICPYGKPVASILDAQLFKGLNGIVLGGKAEDGAFRTYDLPSDCASGYSLPHYQEIERVVGESVDCIQCLSAKNPLIAGMHAHLALFSIRPFRDGNKKVARLIGDRMLYDAGLPPAKIPKNEGSFYYKYLCDAAGAYQEVKVAKDRASIVAKRQKIDLFFDFLASKVNGGLDTLIEELSKSQFPEKK